jgi:hypothetical protein
VIYRPSRDMYVRILCLSFASLLAGCKGPSAYKAPVTSFRDSSSVVIESSKKYLSALNKTERDHYINLQAAEPAPIQLIKIDEAQVFNPEEIGARIRALDQLADYTDLLYQLATSDAPATSKARAQDLGDVLTKLSGEVASLAGSKNDAFKSAATGAFSLIGEVLQAVVNAKLEDALKKAIASGDQPVNNLINAIETDARIAYQRKRTSLSSLRRIAVDAYNKELENGARADRAKLRDYAGLISETEDRWEAFQTARPVDGLEALRQANSAMVKFAKTPKPTVSDFASFVDAMEAFAATAKRVGQAVQQLEQH